MRRILLGLLLGALIFGVSFAGAKVATVTNPMERQPRRRRLQHRQRHERLDTDRRIVLGPRIEHR